MEDAEGSKEDATDEEELNLGLAAVDIVTGSTMTEDVASLETSLEPEERIRIYKAETSKKNLDLLRTTTQQWRNLLATGEGDFDLLTTGESTRSTSTSHSKSRLTPDGRFGDPVDFLATFFSGEESSP